jgi:hypothetical protein
LNIYSSIINNFYDGNGDLSEYAPDLGMPAMTETNGAFCPENWLPLSRVDVDKG